MLKLFLVLNVVFLLTESTPVKHEVDTITDDWKNYPTHMEFREWLVDQFPGQKISLRNMESFENGGKKPKYHIILMEDSEDSSSSGDSSDSDSSGSYSYEYSESSESESSGDSSSSEETVTEAKKGKYAVAEPDTKKPVKDEEGVDKIDDEIVVSFVKAFVKSILEWFVKDINEHNTQSSNKFLQNVVEEMKKHLKNSNINDYEYKEKIQHVIHKIFEELYDNLEKNPEVRKSFTDEKLKRFVEEAAKEITENIDDLTQDFIQEIIQSFIDELDELIEKTESSENSTESSDESEEEDLSLPKPIQQFESKEEYMNYVTPTKIRSKN